VSLDRPDREGTPPPGRDLDSTTELLARIRRGDAGAKDRLIRRYLGVLTRWAHGRLPARARALSDTDDLVQSTFIRTLEPLGSFQPQHDGAFLAYLRKALLSTIRDEIRRAARKPGGDEASEDLAAREPSPVEEAIGRETFAQYDAAMEKLSSREQQAVFLRVELGLDYRSIADALGAPSANAARMCVARAVARLAESMRRNGIDG
jgi:RNA polymerase sigma factor (sigma-70 family)